MNERCPRCGSSHTIITAWDFDQRFSGAGGRPVPASHLCLCGHSWQSRSEYAAPETERRKRRRTQRRRSRARRPGRRR